MDVSLNWNDASEVSDEPGAFESRAEEADRGGLADVLLSSPNANDVLPGADKTEYDYNRSNRLLIEIGGALCVRRAADKFKISKSKGE